METGQLIQSICRVGVARLQIPNAIPGRIIINPARFMEEWSETERISAATPLPVRTKEGSNDTQIRTMRGWDAMGAWGKMKGRLDGARVREL
jgi:hypothetical protein